MDNFKKAHDTDKTKYIISTEFIIENNELLFFYLSYSHRKILIDNEFFFECCKELLNNFIFQYKCGKINFYNTEYYQTILLYAQLLKMRTTT